MTFEPGAVGLTEEAPATRTTSKVMNASAPPADPIEAAVAAETVLSTPPPEVEAAIEAAALSYDQLEAQGQHLHFALDPPTGRVSVELQDLAGNLISVVSPSKALGVAEGGDVEL